MKVRAVLPQIPTRGLSRFLCCVSCRARAGAVTADYAVEQIPIELIEPGDFIIARPNHGKPYAYQVHVKRVAH